MPEQNDKQNEELDDDFAFLEDVPASADDYEVEVFEGQDDEGCEGGACKI